MTRSRSIEETTKAAMPKENITATADDLKFLKKRRRDLITKWIAYVIGWYLLFYTLFHAGTMGYWIDLAPIVFILVATEDLIEGKVRKHRKEKAEQAQKVKNSK